MQIIERGEFQQYLEDERTSFFSISPIDPQGEEKSRKLLEGSIFKRKTLANALEVYNKEIGNDQTAMRSIDQFREPDSVCVFTGQQLGAFGGPTYTILKAISCLILSKKANAVPVFWLATEDHDVDEIDHTYLIDNLGNLNKFHLTLPKNGRFVEDLELNDEHRQVIDRFFEVIGNLNLAELIDDETSYSQAMAKVLVQLFKGTGLVFVEPYLLRPFAKEFLKREIQDCEKISSVLKQTTKKLQESGGTPILEVSEATNLFLKVKGMYRSKIQLEDGCFRVGKHTFSREELLALIEKEPERFSTNAAARCVLQSTLFPVLAYVAGPGEIAYYHQLKDYHAYHGIAMPWIVPRLSATLVTPMAQEMLDNVGIQAWDPIPKCWKDVIPSIGAGAKELTDEWIASADRQFGDDLSEESINRFIRFQSEKLEKKAILARLRKKGIAPHSLHYLRNLLHPHEMKQERVINWLEFQSHTSVSIIHYLSEHLNEIPRGHLYCYL